MLIHHSRLNLKRFSLVSGLMVACLWHGAPAQADQSLLNVSFDPTRELYQQINEAFAVEWRGKHKEAVDIKQSHGGSGKQARAVIDGLRADVVTLALGGDIDEIAAKTKLLPADWAKRLPNNSVPYSSTIVFVVHKGNPKNIKDWGDLAQSGLQVITPNPKTSGGARWNFLAAWAWGAKAFGGDEAKIKNYVTALYHNVPVLDTGARGSTTTFAERGIGDVLISWESDAQLVLQKFGSDNFEIIYPSLSIAAETPVALVDGNAKTDNAEAVSQAYLEFLYSPTAQTIAAKNHFRPSQPSAVDPADLTQFAKIDLVTIDGAFGGWAQAQKTYFADGAIFDQIYQPVK